MCHFTKQVIRRDKVKNKIITLISTWLLITLLALPVLADKNIPASTIKTNVTIVNHYGHSFDDVYINADEGSGLNTQVRLFSGCLISNGWCYYTPYNVTIGINTMTTKNPIKLINAATLHLNYGTDLKCWVCIQGIKSSKKCPFDNYCMVTNPYNPSRTTSIGSTAKYSNDGSQLRIEISEVGK